MNYIKAHNYYQEDIAGMSLEDFIQYGIDLKKRSSLAAQAGDDELGMQQYQFFLNECEGYAESIPWAAKKLVELNDREGMELAKAMLTYLVNNGEPGTHITTSRIIAIGSIFKDPSQFNEIQREYKENLVRAYELDAFTPINEKVRMEVFSECEEILLNACWYCERGQDFETAFQEYLKMHFEEEVDIKTSALAKTFSIVESNDGYVMNTSAQITNDNISEFASKVDHTDENMVRNEGAGKSADEKTEAREEKEEKAANEEKEQEHEI